MYRAKQLLAGKIRLRNYNGQLGEIMAYVSAINKVNTLGLPVRRPGCNVHLGLGQLWLDG